MNRSLNMLLLAAGLAAACGPAFAQTAAPPARHHHKAMKPSGTVAPKAAATGGINTPAADFSTLEGADDQTPGTGSGSTMRPVMGAGGNIGLGTGF